MIKDVLIGSIFVTLFTVFTGLSPDKGIEVDREAGKALMRYLNQIRSQPKDYVESIGPFMNQLEPMPKLEWNATLAKVAEEKAVDMATRNYFSHVSPEGLGINVLMHRAGYPLPDYMIKVKQSNYFESLSAGHLEPKKVVHDLLVDAQDKRHGHRKHLLGMDEFHVKHRDIGVGFVKAPETKYRSYVCIIIAHSNQNK